MENIHPLMKVCFLGGTRYHQPLDNTSANKFRLLQPLGEFFVIGFSQDLRLRRFTEHAHFYLLPRLPWSILRYVEMFMLGLCLALWLIARHGVHVFVAQSPYEGCAAALAKQIASWLGYKVRLLIENHGDFEVSLFSQRRIILPGLYRFLMRHAARFSLRYADVLRAVSRSTRAQLEQWAPGKPILQFLTWTDIEVFLQAGVNKNRHSGQTILYAGVLIPRKGVHHLLNAFADIARDFPQACLVIVGHEENKRYAAELKTQVRQRKLDGRVQFVGEMPQVQLATWMQRVDIFVLPSMSEGLPRVVVEAMATSLPVIGSNVSGIPDVVENGVTGFLVSPGDESALAAKLRWMLDHPAEAHKMGCQAHAFAERFFSNEAYARSYGQVFEVAQTLPTERCKHAPSAL